MSPEFGFILGLIGVAFGCVIALILIQMGRHDLRKIRSILRKSDDLLESIRRDMNMQVTTKCPNCDHDVPVDKRVASRVLASLRDPKTVARIARENGLKGGYWKNFRKKDGSKRERK